MASFKVTLGLLDPEKLTAYKDVLYWAGVERAGYSKEIKINPKQLIPFLKKPVTAKKAEEILNNKKFNLKQQTAELDKLISAEERKAATISFAKSQITTIRRDILEPQYLDALVGSDPTRRAGRAGTAEPDIITAKVQADVKALIGSNLNDTVETKSAVTIGGQTIQENVNSIYAKNIKGKSTQQILNYLKTNQPEIYNAFELKARNLVITIPTYTRKNNTSRVLTLPTAVVSFDSLSEKNFYFKVSPPPPNINFDLYIRSGLQKIIVSELQEALTKNHLKLIDKSLEELVKYTDGVNKRVNFRPRDSSNIDSEGLIAILGNGTPGSVPQGRISATAPRRKSSAFTSRTAAARETLRETRQPSMSDFITDDTITALTKREMMRRMPIGPVGGRPLSSRVLTYRTGRFVQSLQVFQDMRNEQMQYYYNPNYWVHETTSRDPRNLIGASLNSVTRALFKKRFNISKSDSRGN